MAFSRNWVIVAVGLGALVAACDRDDRALGTERDRDIRTTPAPAARPPTTNRPVELIAQARCDLEMRCGNVGIDRRYDSRDTCLSRVRADRIEELNTYECPGGFDQKELDECLTEIRNNDCDNPLDSLGRVLACRASDICKNF